MEGSTDKAEQRCPGVSGDDGGRWGEECDNGTKHLLALEDDTHRGKKEPEVRLQGVGEHRVLLTRSRREGVTASCDLRMQAEVLARTHAHGECRQRCRSARMRMEEGRAGLEGQMGKGQRRTDTVKPGWDLLRGH